MANQTAEAAAHVTVWSTLWPMGGVLSGSLLIAWATEVLSFFLSRGMAFAVLALLQVLPEFAVEAVITLQAAADPTNLQYVTANFTGANRLIVGLFVPMVFFMASAWARKTKGERIRYLELPKESSVEVMALILATFYSFLFVIRGSVNLGDAVFLIGLYATYLYMTYKLPPSDEDEGELPLVPRKIRTMSIARQKAAIFALFAAGGSFLFFSVEPFYHNTLALGAMLGIGSYFLLQWLAPFLSEFPEFITILYWGRTGRAELGLTNAISSKVNQWTLLIAMIPVVYAYGTWKGGAATLDLSFDSVQRIEVLLTAAQGLFAAACFFNLRFHRWEAWTLLGLWLFQLLDPLFDGIIHGVVGDGFPTMFDYVATPEHRYPPYIREWTTLAYLILTPFVLFMPKHRFAAAYAFRDVLATHFRRPGPGAPAPAEAAAAAEKAEEKGGQP